MSNDSTLLNAYKYAVKYIEKYKEIKVDPLFVTGIILQMITTNETLDSIEDSCPRDTISMKIDEQLKKVQDDVDDPDFDMILDMNDTIDGNKFDELNLPQEIIASAYDKLMERDSSVYRTTEMYNIGPKLGPYIIETMNEFAKNPPLTYDEFMQLYGEYIKKCDEANDNELEKPKSGLYYYFSGSKKNKNAQVYWPIIEEHYKKLNENDRNHFLSLQKRDERIFMRKARIFYELNKLDYLQNYLHFRCRYNKQIWSPDNIAGMYTKMDLMKMIRKVEIRN